MRLSPLAAAAGASLAALAFFLRGALAILSYSSASLLALSGLLVLEEKRMGSREVALIAALSVLSAAARILFAAIPSVQPSTFIIEITGAALGPATGLFVGLLTPLISNLALGMGPWLPWQMMAWGLLGWLAGILFKGWNKGLPAFGLLSGYLYGAITNLSMLFLYYPATLHSFLLLEAYSFPFDTAHAAGNLIFFLALGPRLCRALVRYGAKSRFRGP